MKKTLLLKSVLLRTSILSLCFPLVTFAFLGQEIEDILQEETGVQTISSSSGNGFIHLTWKSMNNAIGTEADFYRVEYGTQSVQQGVVSSYEASKITLDSVPSIKISGLENEIPYFFSIIPIFPDGSEGKPSTETQASASPETQEEIPQNPIVASARSLGEKKILVRFSEDILLPEKNPDFSFYVQEEENSSATLTVYIAEHMKDTEEKNILSEVLLTTDERQEIDTIYRVTVSARVTDLDGNPIESGSTDSAIFTGSLLGQSEETSENIPQLHEGNYEDLSGLQEEIEKLLSGGSETASSEEDTSHAVAEENKKDVTPPEDISNLMSSVEARIRDFLVTLTWTASIDSAGDLDNQQLYRSENRGIEWENRKSLGKEATQTEVIEQPSIEVAYKITTTDTAGNESVGMIRLVSIPALPGTGPIALISLGMGLLGAGIRRWK